jgi:hypothetical protein
MGRVFSRHSGTGLSGGFLFGPPVRRGRTVRNRMPIKKNGSVFDGRSTAAKTVESV